jgi:hypothetical protein
LAHALRLLWTLRAYFQSVLDELVALWPQADLGRDFGDVRFWPKADMMIGSATSLAASP